VVIVPGYKSRGPISSATDFLSGSGTGSLSLVSMIEKLLERKSSSLNLDWDYGCRGSAMLTTWHPLYLQKLALALPTSSGRSVGIVRSRNLATEFFFFFERWEHIGQCYIWTSENGSSYRKSGTCSWSVNYNEQVMFYISVIQNFGAVCNTLRLFWIFLRATHVPVGEDQAHHLQLVQHLAKIFNNRYGHTFPIPKAVVAGNIIVLYLTKCSTSIFPPVIFK
jgi:hypothetical protein